VGGSAQTKATKSVAGSLRVELAQFRELAAFAQFGSDLDEDTKKRIDRGRLLTEILKQKQYSPLSVAEQVVMLLAATKGAFDVVPTDKVQAAAHDLTSRMKQHHAKLMGTLNEGAKPSDETVEQVLEVAREVAKSFKAKENK
jgi:F-type H+-transporting ATPase subunit alpha